MSAGQLNLISERPPPGGLSDVDPRELLPQALSQALRTSD